MCLWHLPFFLVLIIFHHSLSLSLEWHTKRWEYLRSLLPAYCNLVNNGWCAVIAILGQKFTHLTVAVCIYLMDIFHDLWCSLCLRLPFFRLHWDWIDSREYCANTMWQHKFMNLFCFLNLPKLVWMQQ